jgi:hypothetical protein
MNEETQEGIQGKEPRSSPSLEPSTSLSAMTVFIKLPQRAPAEGSGWSIHRNQRVRGPLQQATACTNSSLQAAIRTHGNNKFWPTLTSLNCTCATFVSSNSVPDLHPGNIWAIQGRFRYLSSVQYIGGTLFVSQPNTVLQNLYAKLVSFHRTCTLSPFIPFKAPAIILPPPRNPNRGTKALNQTTTLKRRVLSEYKNLTWLGKFPRCLSPKTGLSAVVFKYYTL